MTIFSLSALIRCYYRKYFRHHFLTIMFYLFLPYRPVARHKHTHITQTGLNLWFRQTVPTNQKRSIRNLSFYLSINSFASLNLCTALSTSPPGHPGLPATACICVVGLLPIDLSVLLFWSLENKWYAMNDLTFKKKKEEEEVLFSFRFIV